MTIEKIHMSRENKAQDKLRARVGALLKLDQNKKCADCDDRQPRWASANLQVFMCIKCSGIHRSLGVHVSRVKSVNLDTWTEAEVEHMEKSNNEEVNRLYEVNVPSGRKINTNATDNQRDRFIRDKYEHKVWYNPGGKDAKKKGKKKEQAKAGSDEEEVVVSKKAEINKPIVVAKKVAPVAAPQPSSPFDDDFAVDFSNVSFANTGTSTQAQSQEPFADSFTSSTAQQPASDMFGDFSSGFSTPQPVSQPTPTVVQPTQAPTAAVNLGDIFSSPSQPSQPSQPSSSQQFGNNMMGNQLFGGMGSSQGANMGNNQMGNQYFGGMGHGNSMGNQNSNMMGIGNNQLFGGVGNNQGANMMGNNSMAMRGPQQMGMQGQNSMGMMGMQNQMGYCVF
jgi:stromal membrane-associated protein